MSAFDDWYETTTYSVTDDPDAKRVRRYVFNAGLEAAADALRGDNLRITLTCKDFCYSPESAALLIQEFSKVIRALKEE